MTITVLDNNGREIELHAIENSESPAFDYDVEIGELYGTEEGITVVFNDGTGEYSIAR